MATTLAMSPRHFSSTIRLSLQHLPPRLIRQLPPRLRPEIPPRLRNKLQRHPNRPEPSAEPVIEDDVILAARKMDLGSVLILRRGQQVTHEKELNQAVTVHHQHEVNEKPKTTTAKDFPKTTEDDQQNQAKEEEADNITVVAATTIADNLYKPAEDDSQHEINVETKITTTVTTTTAVSGDLPKTAEGDQHEVKEQEPNQIIAEDDDHHVDVKEDEEKDEGVKKDDKKGLWDNYFTTIAPTLMPPPPTALPLPTLLIRKPLVN